jgi:hypothetical protein
LNCAVILISGYEAGTSLQRDKAATPDFRLTTSGGQTATHTAD